MTETANYGLKLMERADSGNWITGGMNGNTAKIDEVMKQLSDQLTDANGLITGLQNQLDTTNGSMTAQGGQITELGNLINGANGNIATLTQAVEDLQTKQPTGNVYEFERKFADVRDPYHVKMKRVGNLVMGAIAISFLEADVQSSLIRSFRIYNVPKDFLPRISTSLLSTKIASAITCDKALEFDCNIDINKYLNLRVETFEKFFDDNYKSSSATTLSEHVLDKGELCFTVDAESLNAMYSDTTLKKTRISVDKDDGSSVTPFRCFFFDFAYMAN